MILLVPGKVWDAAMANLGPKNPVEIKEGVQIMNAVWDKEDLKYMQKYDIRKPAEFSKWLKASLENEEFKKVQEKGPTQASGPVVPTVQTPSAPIQPLMSGIVRPANSYSSYVAAGEGGSVLDPMQPGGDICSMRIISRPR